MAIEWEDAVGEIVERAGLLPRPAAVWTSHTYTGRAVNGTDSRLRPCLTSTVDRPVRDSPADEILIHTKPVPPGDPSPSGIIAWEEGCLKCAVCVKKRCVYKVYDQRGLDTRQMIDSIDNECMSCLRCVQGCPKELIHKSLNPEFKRARRRPLDPRHHRAAVVPGRDGKDPRFRRRLPRTVQRSRLRRHVDRHVGDRQTHAGRDPRQRIYQHRRRHRQNPQKS